MRLNRIAVPLMLAVGAIVLINQPALAGPYPAESPGMTASSATVSDGGALTFTGHGFAAGELIEIDVVYSSAEAAAGPYRQPTGGQVVTAALRLPEAVVKTLNADSNGDFATTVTLTEPGTATVTAHGMVSDVSVAAVVTVLAAVTPASGLATTGRDLSWLPGAVGGGVAAVVVGFMLVLLTVVVPRRRRAAGRDIGSAT